MNEIYNAHEIKCKLPRRNNYARSEPMGWAERNIQFSTHTHTVISTQNSVFKEGRCCGGSHLHRTMRRRASLVRESFFGEFFVRGSLARESFVRGSLVRGLSSGSLSSGGLSLGDLSSGSLSSGSLSSGSLSSGVALQLHDFARPELLSGL